jgi:hypothetical protein
MRFDLKVSISDQLIRLDSIAAENSNETSEVKKWEILLYT